MKNYGLVYSFSRPTEVELTATKVYVATNIEECIIEKSGQELNGFKYNYYSYTKDEYIQKITEDNATTVSQLEEELNATKILLGVE